jgi:hypothetical protein
MSESKGFSDRVERWLSRIPGVRTYRDREHRRETDKRLRERLAARLQECRSYLKRLTLDLSQKSVLDPLDEIDRLSSHLQQLADTIQHAGYGYGGIFDLEKIREEELDLMYDFDLYLMDDADAVYGDILELRPDLALESWTAKVREIEERVDGLEQRYQRRREFMTRPA